MVTKASAEVENILSRGYINIYSTCIQILQHINVQRKNT